MKKIGVAALLLFSCFNLKAQLNSPYSRYALGDLVSGQNIVNTGMGGVAVGYADFRSVNFVNPASYARLKLTTFDVGFAYNSLTLKQENPFTKYNSASLLPTYLNLAVPTGKNSGLNIGLKPVNRISYEINNNTRLPGIDSVAYVYQGNGGVYQAYIGYALGTKNFSVGVNAGYMFGNKSYATKLIFINDTVDYKKANYADTTSFGNIFVDVGLQYIIHFNESTRLTLGAYSDLKTNMTAKRNTTRETFEFSTADGTVLVDSVYALRDQKGKVVYPATYGFGFMFGKDLWSIGADFIMGQWSQFSYYGEPDLVKDNWTMRMGGEWTPSVTATSYWSKVTYRAGFYFGPDIVAVDNNLPRYGISMGAAFPMRRNFYTNQTTMIQTAFEYGTRGNKDNTMRENFFKVSVGLSLSDVWFIKKKYQ
jgi:hypothetical protein